jgi:hypothetical protein
MRVPSITPTINSPKIEVTAVRISSRKASGDKVWKHRIEIGKAFAQPLCGYLWRYISGIDAEAHDCLAHTITRYRARAGQAGEGNPLIELEVRPWQLPFRFGIGGLGVPHLILAMPKMILPAAWSIST